MVLGDFLKLATDFLHLCLRNHFPVPGQEYSGGGATTFSQSQTADGNWCVQISWDFFYNLQFVEQCNTMISTLLGKFMKCI